MSQLGDGDQASGRVSGSVRGGGAGEGGTVPGASGPALTSTAFVFPSVLSLDASGTHPVHYLLPGVLGGTVKGLATAICVVQCSPRLVVGAGVLSAALFAVPHSTVHPDTRIPSRPSWPSWFLCSQCSSHALRQKPDVLSPFLVDFPFLPEPISPIAMVGLITLIRLIRS